jgi:RNA polymerase primary sigma factor
MQSERREVIDIPVSPREAEVLSLLPHNPLESRPSSILTRDAWNQEIKEGLNVYIAKERFGSVLSSLRRKLRAVGFEIDDARPILEEAKGEKLKEAHYYIKRAESRINGIAEVASTKEVTIKTLEENRKLAVERLAVALQSPQEIVLRDHQVTMIEELHKFLAESNYAGYFSEPTGAGKSAAMAKIAQILGMRTVVLSPTQQVEDQTKKAATRFSRGLSMTTYDGRQKDASGMVINTTYSSVGTLIESGQASGQFDPREVGLVICDEAHLGLGEMRHTIYKNFPNALMFAFTATPDFSKLEYHIQRGKVDEGEHWVGMFKNLVHEMTIEEAMETGILTHLDAHIVRTNTRVENIEINSAGDYKETDLMRYFSKRSRNELVVGMLLGVEAMDPKVHLSEAQRQEIQKIHEKIKGKRTAIFGLGIKHIDEFAEELRNRGLSTGVVHSKIEDNRSEILESHTRGETQIVLGVGGTGILGIGWDSPETEVGIFMRPTISGVKKVQELGRILRPSEGKSEAIAIELLDSFQEKFAPVLIPNVFDPNYVIRGSRIQVEKIEGEAARTRETTSERPIVTFSGMNIEAIVEEARSRDMLRNRFKQADVREIAETLDSMITRAHTLYPTLGSYGVLKLVAEGLPYFSPSKAQEEAIQAIASVDSNSNVLGRKALILLNLRTLMTVADNYFFEDTTSEEKDEITQAAIAGLLNTTEDFKSDHTYQAIHRGIREGIVLHLAEKNSMPAHWLRVAPRYRLIEEMVRGELGENTVLLDHTEINSFAEELAEETEIGPSAIADYLRYRNYSVYIDEENEPRSGGYEIESEVEQEITKELLEDAMQGLVQRERAVLKIRFGLIDGIEHTLKETSEQIGVSSERVRGIEAEALAKLRMTKLYSRIFGTRHYLDSSDQDKPKFVHESPQSTRFNAVERQRIMAAPIVPIEALGLTPESLRVLRNNGIKDIVDYLFLDMRTFRFQGEHNDWEAFQQAFDDYKKFEDLYRQCQEGEELKDVDFLYQVTDKMLVQNAEQLLSGLWQSRRVLMEYHLDTLDPDNYDMLAERYDREALESLKRFSSEYLEKAELETRRNIFAKAYLDLQAGIFRKDSMMRKRPNIFGSR